MQKEYSFVKCHSATPPSWRDPVRSVALRPAERFARISRVSMLQHPHSLKLSAQELRH